MQLSSILSSVHDLLGDAADKANKASQAAVGTAFEDHLKSFAAAAEGAKTKLADTPATEVEAKVRAKVAETSQDFEASVLSTMMQSMFAGVSAGAFSGGEGEKQFKSLLVDAFAKQTAKAGGFGIADQVAREMLKLQGLTDAPAAAAPTQAV